MQETRTVAAQKEKKDIEAAERASLVLKEEGAAAAQRQEREDIEAAERASLVLKEQETVARTKPPVAPHASAVQKPVARRSSRICVATASARWSAGG